MVLNDFGKIVAEQWEWLEAQYDYVELGEWVVMPNHFHGILVIRDGGRVATRPYTTDQNQIIGRTDRCIQNRIVKTYQFITPNGRNPRLAAQLL